MSATSLDLFTDSVRLMGDATLVSVMDFDRRLEIGRLEGALSRCFEAFPILGCRLVRNRGPAYWEPEKALGGVGVEIIEERAEDTRTLQVNPIDPHRAPQARLRVVRSSDRDTLVLSLAHAAGDGHGLKVLSRALLEFYSGSPSFAPAQGILPERDTLWTRDLLEEELEDADELWTTDPMWPGLCSSSSARSSYHAAIIPVDGVERIKTVAHAHGGTVNDVLLASFFLTMSDLTGHRGPQDVFFPVDLRRYLPPGSRLLTNQAANVSFPLIGEREESMASVLPRVVRETSRMKAGRMGIREQVAFDRGCDPAGEAVHRMVQRMAARQEKEGMADIFFSNPGTLDLHDVPGLRDARIVYPGCYMPTTCFVISTFRGRMTVSMGYQDDEEPREATRRMLQGFVDRLPVAPVKVT